MTQFFKAIFFISVLIITASQASWLEQAKQSASSNPSGAASQNCVSGFNETKERREFKSYDQHKAYDSKCAAGEAWGDCLRRLYFGR